MTDKLIDAAHQAVPDVLLTGQAQHLIGALMSHGFVPNNLTSAEYVTLWDVVKKQLRRVNQEGCRAALAQQDAQTVAQECKRDRTMLTYYELLEFWETCPDAYHDVMFPAFLRIAKGVIEVYERKNGLK